MIDIMTAIGTTTGLAGVLLLVIGIFALLLTMTHIRNPWIIGFALIVTIAGLICLLQATELISIAFTKPPVTPAPVTPTP